MELLLFGLNIGGWIQGTGLVLVVGVIVTILRKKGLILDVKKFFGFMEKVTKEMGEALLETSDVFGAADEAIRKDGTLRENKVKDVLKEGKEAVIEWNDAIMVIKPKKGKK